MLLVRFLDIPYLFPAEKMAALSGILVFLAAATGIAACRKVFSVKPLELLREG